MPDAHARPLYPLAPARHLWFMDVPLGVPFATPRTRRASPVVESFSCFPAVQLCHDLGAGSGKETSSLARLDGETMDTIEGRAREGGRSQTSEAPPVVSAASFRSVAHRENFTLASAARTCAKLSALTLKLPAMG